MIVFFSCVLSSSVPLICTFCLILVCLFIPFHLIFLLLNHLVHVYSHIAFCSFSSVSNSLSSVSSSPILFVPVCLSSVFSSVPPSSLLWFPFLLSFVLTSSDTSPSVLTCPLPRFPVSSPSPLHHASVLHVLWQLRGDTKAAGPFHSQRGPCLRVLKDRQLCWSLLCQRRGVVDRLGLNTNTVFWWQPTRARSRWAYYTGAD